jgi:hypothetical protein
MQKARGHPTEAGLPQIVSVWFQVLFHSPLGVLFTFPSRYWSTIGHGRVFSLRRWSSQIPTGFLVSRSTWENSRRESLLTYRTITVFGRPFQCHSAKIIFGNFVAHPKLCLLFPTTPISLSFRATCDTGLGWSPFARRY